MDHFGARLRAALDERGPLCVGIDPHPRLLEAWGLGDDPDGLARFSDTVIEALGDRVAAIKPQSAFFERHGSRGIGVLESNIRQLRDTGAVIVLDVKRGDIGSTAEAYGHAYLDPSSALYVDAITASPFLGFGSLRPMIDLALANGAGIFVLALTSNPEGAAVQRATGADGRTVAQAIFDEISQVNTGVDPLGSIGVVVGATVDPEGHDLTQINGPVLSPGLGAQGGRPEQLRKIFGSNPAAALPSYSREVLASGPRVSDLRDAAERARDACQAVLEAFS